MNTTTPAIQISALEKHYKNFSLGPVDLNVPTGSIYGLIGPNGAGKSTLIDQIFGMGTPNAGTIKVCGFDHDREEVAVKQRAAYVSPELNFASWGKVHKAIRFVRGFRPSWDDTYCARLMKTFDIGLDDKISTLSFGGKIKLSLVLALSWHPEVLILDEPTTGMDAHAKQAMFSELLGIVRDEERTVFISSHQISDLERFADHVGILHRGKMIAEGMISELLERYAQTTFVGSGVSMAALAGFTLAAKEGDRVRGVIDQSRCTAESLRTAGAREVESASMSLEELFLNLTPR